MKHKDLLVNSNVKSVKRRLKVTLENIKFQQGKAFVDDIEKIDHCIKALENIYIKIDKIESQFDKYVEINELLISNYKKQTKLIKYI